MRSDRVAAEACWPATRHPCTASHLLWKLCARISVPCTRYQVPHARCQVLCFKFELPCARCNIQGDRCYVLGASYSLFSAGCQVCQVFLVPLSACDARCPRRGKYLIRESIHRRARVHGREIAASSSSTPMWSVRQKNGCKYHYLLLLGKFQSF